MPDTTDQTPPQRATNTQSTARISFESYFNRALHDYFRKLRLHHKKQDYIGYTTEASALATLNGDHLRIKSLTVGDFQSGGFTKRLGVFTYALFNAAFISLAVVLLFLYLVTGTASQDIRGEGAMFALEYGANILLIAIYTPWALLELSRFFWIVKNFFRKDWEQYNKGLASRYEKAADFGDVSMNKYAKGLISVPLFLVSAILRIASVAVVVTTLDTLAIYGAFDRFFT